MSPERRDFATIIPIALFGLVGAGLCALGVHLARDMWPLWSRGISAPGVVVEHEARAGSGTDSRGMETVSYYPVVEFRTGDGRSIRFVSGADVGDAPSYWQGAGIKVRYDPAYPARAEIDAPWALWGRPAVCFAFGALCWVAAAAIVVSARRVRRLFGGM